MADGILVFAEQREGELLKAAREVLTAGRTLADQSGRSLSAIVIGSEISELSEEITEYGADRIYIADDPDLSRYSGPAYTKAVTAAIRESDPVMVLFPADAMGRDLAPQIAATHQVGTGSDVTEVHFSDGLITAKRPVYAGKAFVNITFSKRPAVISIRPNTFAPERDPGKGKTQALEVDITAEVNICKVVSLETTEGERPELTEAARIVSGGRGVGSPEDFSLIEELADALGAAVGASRAVVDAGWRPHAEQVGQTGKTVSPMLYVACGISGAIQHLAGMRSSDTIVAINKDPDAPIFQVADYGIVGDLFEVVPRLIEELQQES